MKKYNNIIKKTLLLCLTVGFTSLLMAQATYDANFNTLVFRNNSIEHKAGGNSLTNSGANTIKVYRNVITIGSQAIDAVVRVVQYNNVSDFITFDQSNASGTGFSSNNDEFFSPFIEFGNNGGNVIFNINFILGGSYSANSSTFGTPVILQNIHINTYDIDGNGGTNSNQFNEFGGFSSSEIANNANLTVNYNLNTNLTRFRSTVSSNSSSITDRQHRIKVAYSYVSSFRINVGAGSSGSAYFFLDLSPGPSFTSTVVSLAPNLDLNTQTSGIHNDMTMNCKDTINFTFGNTNITHGATNPSIDELMIHFDRTQFLNNSTDQILIKLANNYRVIPLTFTNNQSFSNITVSGVETSITATVVGNVSKLSFKRSNNATYSLAQAEALVDQIFYTRNCFDGVYEDLVFDVNLRSTSFLSPPAAFNVGFNVPLPLNFVSFEGIAENNQNTLKWLTTERENQSITYQVYSSTDGVNFSLLSTIPSNSIHKLSFYQFADKNVNQNKTFYKVIAIDKISGAEFSSNIIVVLVNSIANDDIVLFPNPANDILNVVNNNGSQISSISVYDLFGKVIFTIKDIETANYQLNLQDLSKGFYLINVIDETNLSQTIKFQKQ
jgi:hypothetical protein